MLHTSLSQEENESLRNQTSMARTREKSWPKKEFVDRHIGPTKDEVQFMLKQLGLKNLDELTEKTLPARIRESSELDLPEALSEPQATAKLKQIASRNKVYRSYLGLGYYNTHTPAVIQRNILENPGWYTQYTPYQAEISQGRLTSLLNFQTMVMELTGLAVANASVLDEATAAAEAMVMCWGVKAKDKSNCFFIAEDCFPQTIDVVKTRASLRGIEIVTGDAETFDFSKPIFGALLQYPNSFGKVVDYRKVISQVHAQGAKVILAADVLALTLLCPPGELGADIAVGSTQRFGVPLGYGGPHAGYLAATEEFVRKLPGRVVGVSKDLEGQPAVRLSLQTREQHIRREKATSNICTAQVLLANMAAMYAIYHGPDGLKAIALEVHGHAKALAKGAFRLGYKLRTQEFFDTVCVDVQPRKAKEIVDFARASGINLRAHSQSEVAISLDETTTTEDIGDLLACLNLGAVELDIKALYDNNSLNVPKALQRQSGFLKQTVFSRYQSETELMRYIRRLEAQDLSLTTSMIPLGSCTMKLNAASELYPVSWPEFNQLHPFVPLDQARGYQQMIAELEGMLAAITGFSAVSVQPNSGAQGEYAGLLTIRKYQQARSQAHRNICLIPSSAHGTNPASAVMAGLKVVVVKCDSEGNIDLDDLQKKVNQHGSSLSVLMVTYPSTHGVFEEKIDEICALIHQAGAQVYLDGANMNAQIGLCRPARYGADVCHLNLHKTFCIPHGGGGPGVGPICVKEHLAEFLPGHCVVDMDLRSGAVSAAPWGSAGILPISWMYIQMMGAANLKLASQVAILNANYVAKKLESHYPILYRGLNGFVAHECIVDLRKIQKTTGVTVEDVAKRLMDYGFHAPTIAWPVAGTMMIEPTESETRRELDRFCEAMIKIREEIKEIETAQVDRKANVVKLAPHTARQVSSDHWDRPYSRERAAYPASWLKDYKFWPAVSRIDSAYGDRNFVCSCAPLEAYEADKRSE